jgi:hypothetical protein
MPSYFTQINRQFLIQVTKVDKVALLQEVPGLEKLKEENGFVFFLRKATR